MTLGLRETRTRTVKATREAQLDLEVLQTLGARPSAVVQEIDSVEYGLTDIQEYYANTGALVAAAKAAKEDAGVADPNVACSIAETFGKDVTPKDLDETLRMEYRTKLLNPRWAVAMADQGSGGAYEISQRMTALIGWGATSNFAENWVYRRAPRDDVEDEEMREKLRKSNPQAFRNVIKRMLEAAGRGMWDADEETLANLRELYSDGGRNGRAPRRQIKRHKRRRRVTSPQFFLYTTTITITFYNLRTTHSHASSSSIKARDRRPRRAVRRLGGDVRCRRSPAQAPSSLIPASNRTRCNRHTSSSRQKYTVQSTVTSSPSPPRVVTVRVASPAPPSVPRSPSTTRTSSSPSVK